MSWIRTYTGRQFWPLDPKPADVDILDIAHALSLVNRFTGHTREPYSVANHAILVAELLPRELQAYGLLHDAGEAYLADVSRPIKPRFRAFRKAEKRILAVVHEAFGLKWPSPDPDAVHAADLRMLASEGSSLMIGGIADWGLGVPPIDLQKVVPLRWEAVEDLFLKRFELYMPAALMAA